MIQRLVFATMAMRFGGFTTSDMISVKGRCALKKQKKQNGEFRLMLSAFVRYPSQAVIVNPGS